MSVINTLVLVYTKCYISTDACIHDANNVAGLGCAAEDLGTTTKYARYIIFCSSKVGELQT